MFSPIQFHTVIYFLKKWSFDNKKLAKALHKLWSSVLLYMELRCVC